MTLIASHPDDRNLTYYISKLPSRGSLYDVVGQKIITTVPYTINGFFKSINVTYIPVLYEYGVNYSNFEWNCKDIYGLELSSNIREQINLIRVNHPPNIINSTVSLAINSEIVFNLTAFDVDGDSVTFNILSLPANGTLYRIDQYGKKSLRIDTYIALNLSENTLYYLPNKNFKGLDHIYICADDTSGYDNFRGSTGIVELNVTNIPFLLPFEQKGLGLSKLENLFITKNVGGSKILTVIASYNESTPIYVGGGTDAEGYIVFGLDKDAKNIIWRLFYGSGRVFLHSATCDGNSNLYLLGSTESSKTSFVTKIDMQGNQIWYTTFNRTESSENVYFYPQRGYGPNSRGLKLYNNFLYTGLGHIFHTESGALFDTVKLPDSTDLLSTSRGLAIDSTNGYIYTIPHKFSLATRSFLAQETYGGIWNVDIAIDLNSNYGYGLAYHEHQNPNPKIGDFDAIVMKIDLLDYSIVWKYSYGTIYRDHPRSIHFRNNTNEIVVVGNFGGCPGYFSVAPNGTLLNSNFTTTCEGFLGNTNAIYGSLFDVLIRDQNVLMVGFESTTSVLIKILPKEKARPFVLTKYFFAIILAFEIRLHLKIKLLI
jgi:hypothetical protein